jgi:signal transduction histidine kinase
MKDIRKRTILILLIYTFGIWSVYFLQTDSIFAPIFSLLLWLGGLILIGRSLFLYQQRVTKLKEMAKEIVSAPHLYTKQLDGQDELAEIANHINLLGKQIKKKEELHTQLVANVAHELRTPLTILRGQLEQLAFEPKEVHVAHLLPLIDETIRMQRLIEDLKQLSLAEAKQITLQYSWFAFQPWLEEIITILQLQANEKEIHLQIVGKVEGEVYWDLMRMKQVFINLIGNAIKYSPPQTKVIISTQLDHGIVSVEIKDQGPGISPEKLPYLFQRFYRGEDSRNRTSGGTGLGLAIAKEFVEIHGGVIQVESELKEGTTFHLTIPVFSGEL